MVDIMAQCVVGIILLHLRMDLCAHRVGALRPCGTAYVMSLRQSYPCFPHRGDEYLSTGHTLVENTGSVW